MKKNIFMLTFLMLLMFSGIAFPQDTDVKNVQLHIYKNDDKVVIEVKNISDSFKKINSKFSLDPVAGVIHFVFEVNGNRKDLLAQINAGESGVEDYLILSPGSFYGSTFDLNHLKKMYGVGKNCYNLSVYYLDNDAKKFGAFGERVNSNSIRLCK